MGLKNRVEEDNCSVNEALLFATISIIGLQVDVHLKDGSVYSGIFHTASVEKEYGIVLKKAKLTKQGRCATNVANGSVVETLVILAGDLVQVFAKGVPLPLDGFAGNLACGNGEPAPEIPPSSANSLNGTKKFNKSTMDERISNTKRNSAPNENGFVDGFISMGAGKEDEGQKLLEKPMGNGEGVEYHKREETNIEQREDVSGATVARRQVGEDGSQLSQDEFGQNFKFHVDGSEKEVQHSVSSCESSALDTLKPVDGELDNHCERPSATDIHQDAVCSGVSISSNPAMNVSPESCQRSFANPTATLPPQNSELNKNSKEFKLNPGAKIFSPSFVTGLSVPPPIVPTVANMSYLPSNSPMVAVAGSQPEVGMGTFAPRSSAPKFVSYGNLSAATGVSGSQFSQAIVGHMGNRTQPVRYASQYHPVQAAPAYLNPNSQAVMFGHMGQLICVPVSHDLVPNEAAISPEPARPPLTPHHVQFPKHQGSAPDQALQFCVPQPFIAGGQPPLAVPSHIPYLQPPFPVNRPIQIPGSNGLFSTKLP
ncbi:hypothetical protein E1A91_A04G019600v1 [Gossypium mustelinum]|uniref:Ataxin 2 SM domain-containing protein n=1 Tax=Gossypium mustelinum TaxID=34275 RepID=A0A5D2ZM60_GOSMU|nr:hypothetical protein E1A91_A04G019600v1 [Gossypium mustelinum]